MSDLKFAADGATRRYDLKNDHGTAEPSSMLKFLAWLGEYDLHWDEISSCYTVVRARAQLPRASFNYTDYKIMGNNLEPEDEDVVLDPYHMCLLYEAHEHFGFEV